MFSSYDNSRNNILPANHGHALMLRKQNEMTQKDCVDKKCCIMREQVGRSEVGTSSTGIGISESKVSGSTRRAEAQSSDSTVTEMVCAMTVGCIAVYALAEFVVTKAAMAIVHCNNKRLQQTLNRNTNDTRPCENTKQPAVQVADASHNQAVTYALNY